LGAAETSLANLINLRHRGGWQTTFGRNKFINYEFSGTFARRKEKKGKREREREKERERGREKERKERQIVWKKPFFSSFFLA
jgi:hypothetical protein